MLVNLKDVLIPARKGQYAVGLFNAPNLELARGIIEAAKELRSPVIIGTAEVLLPITPLEDIAAIILSMARRATVPVVLHFDHGLTFENCLRALQLGFTSIMYDCSTDTYEENVRKVGEMSRIAHAFGASIEAELGHVGDNEGSVEAVEGADTASLYTDPEQAQDFVTRTDVDALAVAVGSAHGAYKLPPKLDFDRIDQIARVTGIPLVLHGGSGLTPDDFKRAIAKGINKVNIFTDINVASAKAVRDSLAVGKSAMTDLIAPQIEATRQVTMEKMRCFASDGKA